LNKRFIQHGLWSNFGARNRRTNKYIPIPLKLRELLQKKADKFGLDVVEFTYGTIPELFLSVIAIVHPLDHFCRRVGYKITTERLDWAERMVKEGYNINHKSWAYVLTEDGT